jgi:Domain of Unknown Function with PDB structure (DUF3857)/Transglutaminase-like superfamily
MTSKSYCNPARLRLLTKVCKNILKIAGVGALFVAFLAVPSRAADAPAWMHALTSAPLPQHDEKAEAVVMYFEEILTVEPNGRLKETDRVAYKILRPNGRHLGKAVIYFDPETKINHFHGWCIPAQGKDYEVKDKDVEENGLIGLQNGELFSDHRVKVLQIPASEPGNIIGYELEHEKRPYILQDEWGFQDTIPVALARYTLQLPQGWEYKAVWINHPEVAPAASGSNQWSWELKDIPAISREEAMPPWRAVAGLLLVALIPPGGATHGFLTWSEMGAWQTSLLQGRLEASPEIKQKVAELTVHAGTPFAKMLALADFMQSEIRYVGIWLGIGGYQPHTAPDVFSHRYGDCKDKATLLSVMLKEVGIQSYYVVINSERGSVSPSIAPHLGLFDHVILAIRLPDGVSDRRLQAILQDSKLGRLLIFDPTDELTPFGSLRGDLQASYALLVTPDGGELRQMPQLNPGSSGTIRTASVTLDANGVLRGQVEDQRFGDAASWQRDELRIVEKDSDRIKPVERLMTDSLGSFQITKATMTNLKDAMQPFTWQWSFVAPNYAKSAGDLLLVRPRILGVKAEGLLETKEARKYAVEFPGPRYDSDSFSITLPPGYEVDELPPPTDADYSFGSYHSKTVAEGNVLHYTRSLEIKQLSVPVSETENLKKFYRAIANDERGTAVLKPSSASSSSR